MQRRARPGTGGRANVGRVAAVAIRAEGLRKRYRLGQRESFRTLRDAVVERARGRRREPEDQTIWALDGVSFDVHEGEILGIVGRNGAGKSTLLKILSRITEPTEGWAEIHGRVGSLLEVGTGFHPELTGRENVYLNGAILGMRRGEIDRKLGDILEFSGVERFIDTPLKYYSTGMSVRLGFAVAAHLEPEIMVVDEVLAVGDAAFQERCLAKMRDVAGGGRTVLFVSHNMAAISALCPEAVWLDAGRIQHRGPSGDVIARYLASVRAGGSTLLDDRLDRRGTGALRVTRIALEDDRAEPVEWVRSGEPLRIVLEYEAEPDAPLDTLTVNVTLSADGRPVASFMSDVSGTAAEGVPASGRAVCSIPRLPLLPGHYDVRFSCLLGREVVDKLDDAGTIVVAAGDFYGTGRLPPQAEYFGPVLVEHRWAVEPAVAPERTVAEVPEDVPAG